MFIRISENTQVIRKREGKHRFEVHITIKAEADMRFDIVKGVKKLVGANYITAIIFEPGTNFVAADTVAGMISDVPRPEMVRKYGEAVSWTELINVSKKVKKENREPVPTARQWLTRPES